MLETIGLLSAISLVIVWVAYPLVVAVLAAFVRRDGATGRPEFPLVTVVVATRADGNAVQARVRDLLGTDYPANRIEVVVAFDAQSDDAPDETLAELDPRVRVIHGDAPGGKAATLNAAVRSAQGEVVVFTDTHQRFAPDAIPRLAAEISRPEIGAVSGSLDLRGTGQWSLVEMYWRFERWLRRSEAQIHSAVGVTGAIYAMRRALWTPLPPGLILDDVYVPMKVVLQGYRVVFTRDAQAFETRHPTWAHEYRRKVRTLTGNIQLCLWLPSVLIPIRNPIWPQFLFHKLLRLLTPYWLLACGLWIAVEGVAWAAAYPLYALAMLVILTVTSIAAAQGLGRSLRSVVLQGALMQVAVITATINGLRGRWDVWAK